MTAEKRKRLWVFGLLAVVALVMLLWAIFHKPAKKPAPPPAVPVTAVHAEARDMQISFSTLGAAQAWTSATIYAQVSGRLIRVNFREGSEVKAGQVLAEVDPAPYKAVLEEAEGTLHRDQAILAGAKRNLIRYQHLQQLDSIARQTYEDQQATVAQDEGTVQIDKGSVAAAQVNLNWTKIRSPVSGRAGVRLVDVGNLVSSSGSTASTPTTASATSTGSTASSGGTGIVVINQVQPIAVTFTVPEGEFERLVQLSNGFARPLMVEAHSQETGELLDKGQVQIADNKVDPATGTVELKARFANAARRLWPGQFIDVKLDTELLQNATLVPTTAVNRGPKGEYVFVVGQDGKATIRPVTIAGAAGSLTAIKTGLKPGEVIVTDGQMTVKAGSQVRIVRPAKPVQAGA